MEVMEDGNLMDKVHILIQRDLSYYKEHQTILQQPICAGVVGGHLDFPLFASFASIKLVLWWEDEFLAGFRLSSGLIKRHADIQKNDEVATEEDHVEIVKTSDPQKFSSLIISSSEQILDHLHALTQEALDHADLSVLTGTIGASSLLKNCIWFYVNKCKRSRLSNESNNALNEILRKFEEMNEAVAERLLDLHCRLLSLYVLQDPDCLNWDSQETFFELERGSYTIQMWWLYMKATRDDLWKTVPPDMSRRVFSGMLNETLTVLTVRYCQASPSMCRSHVLVNDLANLLFCVMNLLPAICNSSDELVGLPVTSENKILKDIHVKCKELFFCFLLRGAPLEILYKMFRKKWDELYIYKPVSGMSPWVMFGLPYLYLDNPSNVKNVSDLQDNVVVYSEITILLAQPQPNWCMLLKKIKQHFWKRWSKEYVSKLQCRTKWTQQQANLLQEGALVVSLLINGGSEEKIDISDVLIPAIENEKDWGRYFDKRQDFVMENDSFPTINAGTFYGKKKVILLPPFNGNLSDADISDISDNENNTCSKEKAYLPKEGTHGLGRDGLIPVDLSDHKAEDSEKEGRGSYYFSYDEANKVIVVKWVDNRVVTLARYFVGVEPLRTVKKYNNALSRVQINVVNKKDDYPIEELAKDLDLVGDLDTAENNEEFKQINNY
ncbi:uncharacterized protein LOC108736195 [Agrilus planipennis]|uniref:Uncharacterized protein LOC108736195 n=1 Tax=Agrilus planipennis TaxID=224129 RepID=A0A7F5RBZ4_AGRPL|nr:uncharacterized protein LOC108736195 [Agrilus planipennis]